MVTYEVSVEVDVVLTTTVAAGFVIVGVIVFVRLGSTIVSVMACVAVGTGRRDTLPYLVKHNSSVKNLVVSPTTKTAELRDSARETKSAGRIVELMEIGVITGFSKQIRLIYLVERGETDTHGAREIHSESLAPLLFLRFFDIEQFKQPCKREESDSFLRSKRSWKSEFWLVNGLAPPSLIGFSFFALY